MLKKLNQKQNNHLYWFGMRESEVESCRNIFQKTITIFGNGEDNNICFREEFQKNINHNSLENIAVIDDFFEEHTKKILEVDPKAQFCSYNQSTVYHKSKDFKQHSIYVNEQQLLKFLNNKFTCKEYFKKIVPILKHEYFKKEEIQNLDLEKSYVLQNQTGCGGEGTFLYNQSNQNEVLKCLQSESTYLVTEYAENNIPINVHLLISQSQVIVLPASIQVIELESNQLAYKGCDYISYQLIDRGIREKVVQYADKIGMELQKLGYLGVCGIDFIIFENEIYFMEINPRFQNSTTLLNRGLVQSSQRTVQEWNMLCFENKEIILEPFEVPYASYMITNADTFAHIDKVPIEILDDIKKDVKYEKDSYICILLYNQLISDSVSNLVSSQKKQVY